MCIRDRLLFIDAFCTCAGEELLGGFMATRLFVDAFNNAFLDRFLNGIREEMPAHGIAPVPDVGDELIKERISAAMRGDERNSTAPLSDRFGNAEEKTLI